MLVHSVRAKSGMHAMFHVADYLAIHALQAQISWQNVNRPLSVTQSQTIIDVHALNHSEEA